MKQLIINTAACQDTQRRHRRMIHLLHGSSSNHHQGVFVNGSSKPTTNGTHTCSHSNGTGSPKDPVHATMTARAGPARLISVSMFDNSELSLFSTRLPDIPSLIHHPLLVLQARHAAGVQYSLPPCIRPSSGREGAFAMATPHSRAPTYSTPRYLTSYLPHAPQYVLRVVPWQRDTFNETMVVQGGLPRE